LSRILRAAIRVAVAVALGAFTAPFVGAVPAAAGSAAPVSFQAACPEPTLGTAQCLALTRTDAGAMAASGVSPQGTMPPGFGPADLQSAYSLPTGSEGTGMTVAIVDAYDLPTAESDLAAYRSQFGLPVCTSLSGCFTKVNQAGGTSPLPDSAVVHHWDYEIALDIEMVSAVCPNCKILLVEAFSNAYSDLGAAVKRAVAMGAKYVSNSYAGKEFSSEAALDTAYYDNPGVVITASTGDCGWNCMPYQGSLVKSVGYPAASPKVIAVGGTSLARNGSARGWTESAWGNGYGGAGSGCSAYEIKPTWQPAGACGSYRIQADVSAIADPGTGVAITLDGSWHIEGGTSAASPIVAAVYALGGAPDSGTYPASRLYADSLDLFDVTSGNNDVTFKTCTTGSLLCNGKVGYDGPTGVGTPNGTRAFAAATTPGKPTGLSAHKGDAIAQLSWTAPFDGGRAISSYTVTEVGSGTVTCVMTGATACTVSGLTNGVPYRFTVHATNSEGDGVESDQSNIVTPAVLTAPTKPNGVTAIGGVGSAWVSWTIPDDDGGSAITGYTVTSTPEGLHCTTTGALSCTVTGLTIGHTYKFAVVANNAIGPGDPSDFSAIVTIISGATYHPMTPPVRLLDTRVGNGLSGKFVANTPRTFQVAGRDVIDAGATAITGNLTVAGESHSGAVYLGPDSLVKPSTSTLNFAKGDVTANGVTVALSSTGTLSATYLAAAGNTTDLVFDVTGFFTPDATGATYHRLTPARLLDTRVGNGLSGKFSANVPRTFAVWLRGEVPDTATAITGNVTVTGSSIKGALYVGPDPIVKPSTSTINFKQGQNLANNVTVALSATGELSATFLAGSGTTDLVFDVTGYYTNDLSGAKYVPMTPTRLLDTRYANGLSGKFRANTPRTVQITDRGVPANAIAVSGNATIVNETHSGAVFVGPDYIAKPPTSTLNFVKGDVRANGLTVALGTDGVHGTLSAVYLAASGNAMDLVLDVTGYYLP